MQGAYGGIHRVWKPHFLRYSPEAIVKTLDGLKKKLGELEKKIEETKKRLPAHSVKPPVMMDLLDLEDQYADVFNQIEKLKNEKAIG
jgi:hypothetical protein